LASPPEAIAVGAEALRDLEFLGDRGACGLQDVPQVLLRSPSLVHPLRALPRATLALAPDVGYPERRRREPFVEARLDARLPWGLAGAWSPRTRMLAGSRRRLGRAERREKLPVLWLTVV